MQLAVDQHESVAIITIGCQRLETEKAKKFHGAMKPLLEKFDTVVLDLRNVVCVDPYGMSALVACRNRMEERGGQLRLCGLTPRVRTFFELVCMHRIFTIDHTIEEALAELTEQAESGREYA